ncbi:MAG: hypothetical protein ACTSXZ_05295, partial [Alphaproteobacteria bacterium]
MANSLDIARLREFIDGLSLAVPAPKLQALAVGLIVAVVLLVLFARFSRLMMRPGQRVALVILTFVSLSLLSLSFAELIHTEKEKRLAVTLVVDGSASVTDDALVRAQQWLDQAYAVRGEHWAQTIIFGRAPVVVKPETEDAVPQLARPDEPPGSHIARAVHTATELFPEQTVRRAVVLTDGNETEGDLLSEASILASHGITLHSVVLDTRDVRDMYMESIHVPAAARPGERVTVGMTVESNFASPARVSITQDGATIFSRTVNIEPGRNNFETEALVTGEGTNVFVSRVGAAEDQMSDNNRLSASLRVVARPRVVLFSQEPDYDLPLVEALTEARLDVQVAGADAIPATTRELLAYDEVILSDLKYEELSNAQQRALMNYTREGGGGLLVAGGQNTGYLAKQEAKLPIKRAM